MEIPDEYARELFKDSQQKPFSTFFPSSGSWKTKYSWSDWNDFKTKKEKNLKKVTNDSYHSRNIQKIVTWDKASIYTNGDDNAYRTYGAF
jgi:hypothetical protein